MSNLAVRKNGNAPVVPSLLREWSPGRLMRNLMGWDPFQTMTLLPTLPFEETMLPATFVPAFEIKQTKDSYVFKADVPGLAEKDLDITVSGNLLTVSGKRESEKEEKTDTYYACERSYGSFTRSFTLPEGADTEHVHADLRDGVLSLIVQKKPEVQAKKIDIKGAAGQKA